MLNPHVTPCKRNPKPNDSPAPAPKASGHPGRASAGHGTRHGSLCPSTLPAAVGAGAVGPLARSSMHRPALCLWSPLAGITTLMEARKREQEGREKALGCVLWRRWRRGLLNAIGFSFLASAFWAPYQEVTGQNVWDIF